MKLFKLENTLEKGVEFLNGKRENLINDLKSKSMQIDEKREIINILYGI